MLGWFVLSEQRGLPGQGRLACHVGLGLVAFCLLEGGRVVLAAGTLRCPIPPHALGDPVVPPSLSVPWGPCCAPSHPTAAPWHRVPGGEAGDLVDGG